MASHDIWIASNTRVSHLLQGGNHLCLALVQGWHRSTGRSMSQRVARWHSTWRMRAIGMEASLPSTRLGRQVTGLVFRWQPRPLRGAPRPLKDQPTQGSRHQRQATVPKMSRNQRRLAAPSSACILVSQRASLPYSVLGRSLSCFASSASGRECRRNPRLISHTMAPHPENPTLCPVKPTLIQTPTFCRLSRWLHTMTAPWLQQDLSIPNRISASRLPWQWRPLMAVTLRPASPM